MNKFFYFCIGAAMVMMPGYMNAEAVEFYETDFNSGLPSGFKVLDLDESPINESYYRNMDFSMGWSVNKFQTAANRSAMSLSRVTDAECQQSNWLITPQISVVSEKAMLRWDARSMLEAFPETYKVMVSTTTSKSASFTEFATIDAENYDWTTRLLSLAEYKGQEIYIAFVCESTNKYILAIDNLTIGELSDEKLVITDATPRFCGDVGTVTATGKIFNAGSDQNWQSLVVATASGEQEFPIEDIFATNSELTYEFEVPVTVGEQAEYTISAKKEDGSIAALLTDVVICSYFKRNPLIDKTTGTWCNNCPDGEIFMKPIKKRYADSLIAINAHYNDPMACTDYFNGLYQWIFNLPTTIVNRDRETITNLSMAKFDYTNLYAGLDAETIAEVSANAVYNESETSVSISSSVRFAKDIDNSTDNYKLGYALVEKDVFQPENYGYMQQNSTALRAEEFYLLPTLIPQDLMVYHDVSREGSTAFKGVDNSLPQAIAVNEDITFDYTLDIPTSVIDKNNLDAVVFIIDRETDIVMNAVRVPCTKTESIAENTLTPAKIDILVYANGLCTVRFMETGNATVDVYSTDGTLLKHIEGSADDCGSLDLSEYKGLLLIKASQNGLTSTRKAIIR